VTEIKSLIESTRKFIGIESDPVTYEIDAGAIRFFAQAIMDNDPLYFDEAYAANTVHKGIIAPPTFYGGATSIRTKKPEHTKTHTASDELASSGWVGFNGSDDFELFVPIRPGDTLTSREKMIDVYEKQGHSGKLIFVTHEKTFTNQNQQVALIRRHTTIYKEAKEEPAR